MAGNCACWIIYLCCLVYLSIIIALADSFFSPLLQCGLQDSISSDDEYRSSRNIAISLFRRYRNFIDRGGADNLKVFPFTCFLCTLYWFFQFFMSQLPDSVVCFHFQEFITAGVNAYALGCTDEGLRKELMDMKNSGIEIDVMQSYGGSTSLKSKIISEEVSSSLFLTSYF